MARGGFRAGSGRPPGISERLPRRKRAPEPDPLPKQAFVDFCGDIVKSGRAAQIVSELLESPDPQRRAWALNLAIQYGVGLPTQRRDLAALNSDDFWREAAELASGRPHRPSDEPRKLPDGSRSDEPPDAEMRQKGLPEP